MKKYLLAAAAATLFSTPVLAADGPAAGEWAVEAKTDFGTFKSDWTVVEADGAWTLDMKDQPMEGGPGGGEPPASKISNLKVDGSTMTFDRALDMGGQTMNMGYTVQIDGDTLSVTVKSDFGDIPLSGTRK